jgi:hypothetical protein
VTASQGAGPHSPTPTRVSSLEDRSIRTAPSLHSPVGRPKEARCSQLGIDWAEAFHLVALGRPRPGGDAGHPGGAHANSGRGADGADRGLEPDPAEVRVVLETRHGVLVERLVEAGYTVLPVNPDLIARRRGPAAKAVPPQKGTTPRTPASLVCSRWTATPACVR